MQLLLNQTSPYARAARVTALEAGFGERLELTSMHVGSGESSISKGGRAE